MTSATVNTYSADFLRSVARDIFVACGALPEEADIVAEHLVANNLRGLDSHGVVRIPEYYAWIEQGTIKPGTEVCVTAEQGGTAVVDCGFNFGQVGALRAVEVAIEKAREHKIACVITRRCNHVGRLGYFTQLAAEAGFFALATVNVPKFGHFVVPFGGREGRLGTNPISYAAPGRDYPIVADMCMSTSSEGKLRVCHNQGVNLPQEWIIDAEGNQSADPKDYYGDPRGWILPLGSDLGYKGYALGLLVELLSGTLAGEDITETQEAINNVCFITIDIGAFLPVERFRELSGGMVSYMKETPLAPGSKEVRLPGEQGFREFAQRQKSGIPVDSVTWQQIEETADALKVRIAEP